MGRVMVVGDVHGCSSELRDIVDKFAPSSDDTIVLAGDVVDKGPDSKGVIKIARSINAKIIMGNHDDKMVRWCRWQKSGKPNPVRVSDWKKSVWSSMDPDDIQWISDAPYYMDVGHGFTVVHGGCLPGVPIVKQKPSIMMRLRRINAAGKYVDDSTPDSIDWQSHWDGPQSLIVGHNVHSLNRPRVDNLSDDRQIWNIDTGCVYGGHLTGIIVGSRDIIQVKARKSYCSSRD